MRFGAYLSLPVAALLLADLFLIGLGTALKAHPLLVLLAHITLIAVSTRWVSRAELVQPTARYISLLFVLIAGPLGLLGILVLAMAELRGPLPQTMLEAWYAGLSCDQRSDPASVLHESILASREFKPDLRSPRCFADVMENGALPEKQTLLGHIGLKYHSDYFPLLASALRSPQAGVRAQAAAVFVKLKEQFRRLLHGARNQGREAENVGDPAGMISCAQTLLDCADSGFLDPSEVRDAREDARMMCRAAMSLGADAASVELQLCRIIYACGGDDELIDRLLSQAPSLASQLGQQIARCLVAAGRHADLHRLINAAHLSTAPGTVFEGGR